MAKRVFRIVIEVEGGATMFDSTNSKKQVDEWVDAATASDKATSISIYRFNKDTGAYNLAQRMTKIPADPTDRPIGFGRW